LFADTAIHLADTINVLLAKAFDLLITVLCCKTMAFALLTTIHFFRTKGEGCKTMSTGFLAMGACFQTTGADEQTKGAPHKTMGACFSNQP